nr:MAG: putative RNA-dependent RNA polymerase [Hubei narna-like virus 5]
MSISSSSNPHEQEKKLMTDYIKKRQDFKWRSTYHPQARRMFMLYEFTYKQFGYSFEPTTLDQQFYEWMASTNRLEKFLKWKTSNILNRSVGSLERVASPFLMHNIPMIFDKYFNDTARGLLSNDSSLHRMKLAKKNRSKYVQFCFSIYQAKGASLPADEWKIKTSEKETCVRLSKEKFLNGTPGLPQGHLMTPLRIIDEDYLFGEIHRTVDEIFPRRPPKTFRPTTDFLSNPKIRQINRVLNQKEFQPRSRVPGRGASWESNRGAGGNLGYLSMIGAGAIFLPYDYLICYFVGPGGVEQVRSTLCQEDIEYGQYLLRQFSYGQECTCAQPIGLPEPFKVRVITKGWTPVYHVAREYQPYIWSMLKKFPQFRLTGEQLNPAIMRQFCSEQDPEQDEWYISGDYQEATDHIPSIFAERILERICQNLRIPTEDIPCLLASLTRHLIVQDGDVYHQRSGQLMGSPTSFYILCIYNAILTRIAIENAEEGRHIKYPLSELPVLINGDDLLFRAKLTTFLTWKSVVNWGGLIPSVGKTLVSKRFGSINSRIFRFDTRYFKNTKYIDATPINHIQLALAHGSMKNGNVSDEHTNFMSKQIRFQEFMDSCPNKARAWKYLFSLHQDYLSVHCKNFPLASLCLPLELGGLGFPSPPIDSVYYAKREPRPLSLILARMIMDHTEMGDRGALRDWRLLIRTGEVPANCAELLLFDRQSEYCQKSQCPILVRPKEEKTILPPSELSYGVGLTNTFDHFDTISNVMSRRKSLHYKILNSLKKYTKSGRGPCKISVVNSFIRSSAWRFCYGKYSSCLKIDNGFISFP